MKPPVLQVHERIRNHVDERYADSSVTEQIIRVFYDVYNELGHGFLESVYEKAMKVALTQAGLQVQREVPTPVYFRGEVIADFRVDMLVNGSVIVELKAVSVFDQSHVSQTLNYLRATKFETALVLNFGPRPSIRRLAFSNERKEINVHKR